MKPDFVVFVGDTIYADGPVKASKNRNVRATNGQVVDSSPYNNAYIKVGGRFRGQCPSECTMYECMVVPGVLYVCVLVAAAVGVQVVLRQWF